MKKVLSILLVTLILMSAFVMTACENWGKVVLGVFDLIREDNTNTDIDFNFNFGGTTSHVHTEDILPDVAFVSDGLEYTLNDDGKSYTVTGIGTCTDRDIVIPNEYNGRSVTGIGYKAFSTIAEDMRPLDSSHCYYIVSITIPDSVTSIDYGAFAGCSLLTNINIPDSVKTIGESAFWDCKSLTNITIGNSLTSIGDGAFNHCTSLVSIIIPDSVTSIGVFVFKDCTSLTNISFTGTVEHWNDVEKSDNWNYNTPATEVICLDGTVTLE